MSGSRASGGGLFVAIGCTLALSVGAIIWGALKVNQRRHDLAELALQSVQQLVRLRLDGFTHELAEDIREESAAVDQPDSVLLFTRWFPLLDTHWPIMTIRLADEYGNELAVSRRDTV